MVRCIYSLSCEELERGGWRGGGVLSYVIKSACEHFIWGGERYRRGPRSTWETDAQFYSSLWSDGSLRTISVLSSRV